MTFVDRTGLDNPVQLDRLIHIPWHLAIWVVKGATLEKAESKLLPDLRSKEFIWFDAHLKTHLYQSLKTFSKVHFTTAMR